MEICAEIDAAEGDSHDVARNGDPASIGETARAFDQCDHREGRGPASPMLALANSRP
jgi:hypothetical protein